MTSTITIGKRRLRIEQDPDPPDPRENDNLGKFVPITNSTRGVNLPNETDISFDSISSELELLTYLRTEHGAEVTLPVYVYDHGNVALSTERTWPFDDRWDSAHIGFIFASKAAILDNFTGYDDSGKRLPMKTEITEEMLDHTKEILRGEVAEYSKYLNGEVLGYVLEKLYKHDGHETIDSCWGFYDIADIADNVPKAFHKRLLARDFDK